MKKLTITSAALFIAIFAASSFAQNGTPVQAVRSFYAFHRKYDSGFSRASVDARRKWFSEDLYKLFLNELVREKAFLREHPNEKPYLAEGLPFEPWDETCSVGSRQFHKRLAFKPEAEDRSIATVHAIFAFPTPCKDPNTIVYTIQVVRVAAGWVIDNVIYDDAINLVPDLKRKDY